MLLRVLVVYFFISFFLKRILFVNASVIELLIRTKSLINKKLIMLELRFLHSKVIITRFLSGSQ